MVKLKNSNLVLNYFVLLLTFTLLLSCVNTKYTVTKIEGKKIAITENLDVISQSNKTSLPKQIEDFVTPYRENIDKDLNLELAYNPETLDKSKGEFQSNIGNFLADIVMKKSNDLFMKSENKSIDICFLNNGGIRTIIPKGKVTARTAYEVMPFENSAVVLSLKSEQIIEMLDYFISEKKPHPSSGISFKLDKNKKPQEIKIQNKPFENNKIYYVVTNDYLANGGDKMDFFKLALQRYDLDYKLRNIMIDYFKEVDTLNYDNSIRISIE